jgi:transposase
VVHLQEQPEIARLYPLVQQFAAMIRQHTPELLETWLHPALDSGIIQLYHSAITLQQEYLVIRAVLATPWSNGQTEGQVNRLKFITILIYCVYVFFIMRLLHKVWMSPIGGRPQLSIAKFSL